MFTGLLNALLSITVMKTMTAYSEVVELFTEQFNILKWQVEYSK
jgi:hypothetical protein